LWPRKRCNDGKLLRDRDAEGVSETCGETSELICTRFAIST
jgi:hypothetical protein